LHDTEQVALCAIHADCSASDLSIAGWSLGELASRGSVGPAGRLPEASAIMRTLVTRDFGTFTSRHSRPQWVSEAEEHLACLVEHALPLHVPTFASALAQAKLGAWSSR